MLPPEAGFHLTYCLNVHPIRTFEDLAKAACVLAPAVLREAGRGSGRNGPVGLGLWIPAALLERRDASRKIRDLKAALAEAEAYVFTLNAFPYGRFHGTRVKENAYRPDWSTPERYRYTLNAARALAALLPPGVEGTISTVPVTFGPRASAGVEAAAAAHLADAAVELHRIRERTGRTVRLALEPEPGCLLERAEDALSFFGRRIFSDGAERVRTHHGYADTAAESILRTHLGVCLDTVHAAVMHEDPAASLRLLAGAGIGVFKIHLGAALGLDADTAAAPALLAPFAEETYLHQVSVRERGGGLRFHLDLPAALERPVPGEWRVHFHLPARRSFLSPPLRAVSGVTPDFIRAALETGTRHFEVEIYTLNILPGFRRREAEACLVGELAAVFSLLDRAGGAA